MQFVSKITVIPLCLNYSDDNDKSNLFSMYAAVIANYPQLLQY